MRKMDDDACGVELEGASGMETRRSAVGEDEGERGEAMSKNLCRVEVGVVPGVSTYKGEPAGEERTVSREDVGESVWGGGGSVPVPGTEKGVVGVEGDGTAVGMDAAEALFQNAFLASAEAAVATDGAREGAIDERRVRCRLFALLI